MAEGNQLMTTLQTPDEEPDFEPTSVHEAAIVELRMQQAELVLPQVVPARYRAAEISHPAVTAWADHIITGGNDSLLLPGSVGVGKTHNAYAGLAAVVRGLAAKGISCQPAAATHAGLVDAARPGGEGIDRYLTADLLVLDDLGSAHVTDWNADVLYRVIDTRWAELRPTIFTLNFDPDLLAERVGPRITSRLFGMCRVAEIEGPDRRMQ
jgi:DNA replication protein DnaC